MSNVAAERIDSSLRFNLKSLFLLLTAVAVLIAPMHWFGSAYLFSAVCSATLVTCCVLAYGVQKNPAVIFVAIVGAFIAFVIAIAALVFALHAFLNAIACVVLVIVRPKRRIFGLALSGLMVAVYGFAFSQAAGEFYTIRALQARYPFESVAPRLSFETVDSIASPIKRATELAAHVAANLDEQDRELKAGYYGRDWALQELHENAYRHFARAAGFGFMRMPSLRESLLELEVKPFAMPWPVFVTPSNIGAELLTVHNMVVTSFGSSDRVGYVRSRDAVAGFLPHQLSDIDNHWRSNSPGDEKWKVVRLELVSLMRHDEPRVYVAETLPQMDELRDVPHRALDDFENSALPKLISEEDVVVQRQPDRILMLGAVRAGKTCVQCHAGERGELLGAFSYELTPIADASASAQGHNAALKAPARN